MAQASGLMNVIRQVGGSFGVAILQTLLTQRIVFHTAVSGALLNRSSPVFQPQSSDDSGACRARCRLNGPKCRCSKLDALVSHFSQQMFVWGINDDFLIPRCARRPASFQL